jgi:UDP-N-acetylmuramate dehydrogenase
MDYEKLSRMINGKIVFNEPMKNHTSLLIGGPAKIMVFPRNEDDLKCLLHFANKNGIQFVVVGNGTKLLVGDKGIDGIVVKMCGCFDDVQVKGATMTAGAGCLLPRVSKLAADQGLSGLEFAIGIPGTVGGGVFMNAGAHGSSISEILASVTAMGSDGKIYDFSREEVDYGFRRSSFQNSDLVILRANLNLKKSNPEVIKEKMQQYAQWRKTNQPLEWPNAGCVFKNPSDMSAGKLIDMAGLKGMRIGDARISEKHANFILNTGNATASDVLTLMSIIEEKIRQNSGIKLETEIRLLGQFK